MTANAPDTLPDLAPPCEAGEYRVTWLNQATVQLDAQTVRASSGADAAFIVGQSLGWVRAGACEFISVERVS